MVVYYNLSNVVVVCDNFFRFKNGGKLCKGYFVEFKFCYIFVSISFSCFFNVKMINYIIGNESFLLYMFKYIKFILFCLEMFSRDI